MYERILIPLDGSGLPEVVLPFAERIARPLDAEVVLLGVVEPLSAMTDLQRWDRAEAGRLPRDRVQVLIRHGVSPEQIAHLARARGADLIVMGTHRSSGLLRWMLGSVAHHMLQTAPCPLLTVGPGAPVGNGRRDTAGPA